MKAFILRRLVILAVAFLLFHAVILLLLPPLSVSLDVSAFLEWYFFGALLAFPFVSVLAFFVVRQIADPISRLYKNLLTLGKESTALHPTDYPYAELRDITEKINNLTIESRNVTNIRRDFFANASHELKTPLTSIKGSAELLCSDVPLGADQRRELLNRIGIEAERLNSLIGDIIMINRLESGEITGDKEELELSALVRECADEVEPLMGQNQLTLHLDLERVKLLANRKNVYGMVSNLVINAVNYTRPGGEIDVNLKTTAEGILLTIRNDSDPIPELHQTRIFERFYRVDRGRSKSVGGTGLGLSIVKHAVDSLGGTIRLESNKEVGVLFEVVIP